MTRRICLSLSLAVLFLTCAVPAFAQFGASIEGTVTDQSGAVVSGATVTATNSATGVSTSVKTSSAGVYRVSHISPGLYTVTAEAPSFRKGVSNNVRVTGEVPRPLDISLQPGQVAESVTVSAGEATVQTETASNYGTLALEQVVNIPQPGRDPYELVRFTPGVFGDGARSGSGDSVKLPQQVGPGGSNTEIFQTENQVQVSSNGQRVSANNIMLDGVSVNSLDWGGAAVVTPNQESVQELTVVSSSFSAEDGRNTGVQIKTVSKSGANSFHGSAIVKFDDPGLNAYNKFYGPTPATPLTTLTTCETGTLHQFKINAVTCPERVNRKYRQFGASVGGPLIKDKLFWFFSYEGARANSSSLVRSVKLDAPAFDKYVISKNPNSIAAKIFQTPGYAARIVNTISETDCCSLDGRPVGAWYAPGTGIGQAIGNGPDGIKDWGVYDLRVPNKQSGGQFNGRLDFNAGKNQFFFSTYNTSQDNLGGGQRPIEDVTNTPNNWIATIGFARNLSNTLLNDFRANVTRWHYSQLSPSGQTNYGIPQIRLFDFDANGLGDIGRFIGVGRSSTIPASLAQNTFAFRDTLSWVHGAHAIRFGGEIVREQNNNNLSGGYRPDYQFRGLLNFANDACCFNESVSINPTTGGVPSGSRHFRTSDYALFVQDEWKFRPNLTLTLGVRWEYYSPVNETNGLMTNYVPGTQGFINGTVQKVSQLYKPDKNNFSPRIGFAWDPWSTGKTVFRGGFGILYNRDFGVIFSNIRQNTPYFAEVGTCCFFDPGAITGAPPGSNILYSIGSSTSAFSYPANPNLAYGVASDGALCGNAACSFVTKVDLYGSLPNEPNAYVYTMSGEMQREVTKNSVFRIGYYGSRSRKLIRTIDVNRLIPGDTFDGNQDKFQNTGSNLQPCGATNPTCTAPHATGNNRFNRIFVPLPDVNASYDSLISTYSYRMRHGLTLNANYTWSHSIDTTSYEIGFQQTDPSNQALNRASSDYDVRHNFSLAAVWEVPFLRGRHDFVGNVLGGWMISPIVTKHSGFPFGALIGSCDTNNDFNGDGYCPDMPHAYLGGAIANPTKQQWMNGIFPTPATEFNITTRGPGCRCRNIFTGPGYTSVDLALGKDFRLPATRFLGEAAKIEFRANAFNVFNILNLASLVPASAPTDILNTGQFGKAPNAYAGRVVEFQARFSF
jgi:hypothetical protein